MSRAGCLHACEFSVILASHAGYNPMHGTIFCCLPQIAPTRLRGTLGSINQLLICVGILGALLVNVALPASAWRAMFGVSALPAVLLGLGAAGKRGWGMVSPIRCSFFALQSSNAGGFADT